jgi:CheY-like chemotaxis protein
MAMVLVIDDDAQLRLYLRTALEQLGHQVVEAAGGVGVLQAVQGQAVDLIFCDLYMPERDGLEVLLELRRERAAVKVIAMSGGYGGDPGVDLLRLARKFGADATLRKPFGLGQLNKALARVLG